MGEDFNEFAWEGQNSAVSSFWIPLVGDYTVLLTVQNDNGVSSGVSEEAKVTFRASPESFLHVQLTWNNAANDQDLHPNPPIRRRSFLQLSGEIVSIPTKSRNGLTAMMPEKVLIRGWTSTTPTDWAQKISTSTVPKKEPTGYSYTITRSQAFQLSLR